MGLSIEYHSVPDLPKLAWLASLNKETFEAISIYHGSAVECHSAWMVEGVWDGDFRSGSFHQAENFFGSGIRIDGDRVYFVSSSALNDHLVYCRYQDRLLVSNSLTVLLGFTGATLDDKHDYLDESMSISKGIREYEKIFLIVHPEIDRFYQVFYENMIVTKHGISFELKNGLHEIHSFEHYYELLWRALCRIKDNYEDPARSIPFSAFTTISSGYDSTAVSCLAKKLGVNTCFTVKKTPSLRRWSAKHSTDDGSMAARALNLKIINADSYPSNLENNELYFLSTNYGKSENSAVLNEFVFSSVASYIEQHCSAAILFTGYHGDKVWDAGTAEKYLGDEIAQSNGANIGLSEIRLKSGFINLAVPFILVRNIRRIVAISRSAEMTPWRLNNNYDRPIPRRIAESHGVPRQSFGMYKKGVARLYYRLPKSRALRRVFLHYLNIHHGLNPLFVIANHALNQAAFAFQVMLRRSILELKHRRFSVFWPSIDVGFYMWVWATRLLSEKHVRAIKGSRRAP